MDALSLIDVSAEDDLLYDLASLAPSRPDPPYTGEVFHPTRVRCSTPISGGFPREEPPDWCLLFRLRFVDLTGDDFPLGSLVGAEATSSVGSPSAAGRAADPDGVMVEQVPPERMESPEQRKAKKGVNLRKSLAWDSAFFTSEGNYCRTVHFPSGAASRRRGSASVADEAREPHVSMDLPRSPAGTACARPQHRARPLAPCRRARPPAPCVLLRGTALARLSGDTVSARRPLRGIDTVVSAQGKFELGLFSPGGSGRFYLGIWYKNVPVQTVIWVGNRVNPLSRSGVASTELRVSSSDGNLELVGLSPSSATPGVLWSSNLSSSSSVSSSPGSNVAVMRDNGNLVLLDGGNSSNVLWHSFDHPTDTLVPEACLGEDKLTGEYQTLTSWRNAEDPAPGMFTGTVDRNGSSEFFYLWNGSRAYWRSGVWTGRVFANLPKAVNNVLFNQTYVEMPAYRRVTSVLYDNATVTRMVLDLTGQTKQFIWVPGSQSWQFFWAAPTVQCDVYVLCGAFGVCNQRSQPSCQCPPGFAPAADRDWGLSDWSARCHRSLPLQCGGNGSTDAFLELPGMKLPDDSLSVAGAQSTATSPGGHAG
ncbi:G-type lectin S-receptor-like serine/threonine-protein kinase At2g19130 [Miscanthus floridulus]|uniref:G-type lectin S-receptor-like serine/threonine-protein kinase At2g19130 n=1 Tax=Miscanthus floridulus TaxID=154761 RepID=UPI0034581C2E